MDNQTYTSSSDISTSETIIHTMIHFFPILILITPAGIPSDEQLYAFSQGPHYHRHHHRYQHRRFHCMRHPSHTN